MTAGPDTQAPPSELQQTQLVVGGMTCASCSARVEKKLGKLTGAGRRSIASVCTQYW